MVALAGYQVLECPGIWKPPTAKIGQDVVVQLGKETLTFLGEDSAVLALWSLDTIVELDKTGSHSCFAPDPLGKEYLLIDDELMVEALSAMTVSKNAPAADPPSPWAGFGKFLSFMLILVGITYFFSENIADSMAGAIVGPQRSEIGETLFNTLLTDTYIRHKVCPVDPAILDKITVRLFPEERIEIRVVSGGVRSAEMLPGQILVVSISEFDIGRDRPERLAGILLLAHARNQARDSLAAFLHEAGVLSSIRLLLGREISPYIFETFAAGLASRRPIPVSEQELYREFAELNLATEPFALYLLAEGLDPEKFVGAPYDEASITFPLLEDSEWVALQNSCVAH